MEEFWKDDFRPLRWAGKAILQALRDDEDAPDADLYRRLTQSQEGSHLYFASDGSGNAFPMSSSSTHPYNIATGSAVGTAGPFSAIAPTVDIVKMNGAALVVPPSLPPPIVGLKHRQSLPLPSLLTEALKRTQVCSFMGLLLSAQMAWMTVDDKLFLFSSENPTQGTIQCFENPRKQPILTVASVKPKEGVFKDIVECCLVVTTPEEVILLALARVGDTLKIIPTSFMMPTDLVRIQCAVGTEDGRIFLGGDDECVHEMVYHRDSLNFDNSNGDHNPSVEELLEQFYDGTADVPDVVTASPTFGISDMVWNLGKRSLSAVTSSLEEDASRKCRKLNRTTQASSIATALVPNIVRRASAIVFGGLTASGRVVRLLVDAERQILYSLTEKGWISVLDISRPDAAPVVAVCDVPKTARLYLEAVARGQMFPPTSGSSTIGSIHFPGGGAAAQAGVGGMEGARNILKLADWQRSMPSGRNQNLDPSRQTSNKQTTHPIIKPIALHVIPGQDSARLTLMAVTGGGLRLYFSALSSAVLTRAGHGLDNGNRSLGSKLSLCHIRSPPPLNMSKSPGVGGSTMWSAEVAGGILPRVSGSIAPRVDASHYKDGRWVVALEDPSESVGCDIIVAATPDTVFRSREASDGKRLSERTGGLGESITFPISATRDHGGDGAHRALSGGLVWDIDSDIQRNTGTLELLLHSPTPSNADLEVGLPPVYYPPPQIRPGKSEKEAQPSESRALVQYNPSVRSTAFQAMKDVVLNVLLSRPLNHGPHRHQDSLSRNQPVYRISKRTGENGFSLSSLERQGRRNPAVGPVSNTTSNKSHVPKQPKSARLRDWILCPPTKSLNQWTKQHLLNGKEVITVLNVQGVHKFEFDTVLSLLADALMAAGDNVSDDARVTSFFTGFGFKEGCAMCLALAIGCGPAEGTAGYSQQLRRRASAAALARAYKPNLKSDDGHSNGSASAVSTSNTSDNCVPVGYTFLPSALSQGLFLLVSRLLRPIWHKPLIVVTEGRSVYLRWDSGTMLTSAKVEILLGDRTLDHIRINLQALLSLVKTVFSRAIDVVPGTLGQQYLSMEINGGVEQHQYLTQALQYHSQLRSAAGASAPQLSPKECDNIAYLLEERNIHSLYRLVARAVQLLDLLSLLRKSADIAAFPQVDWGLLHGILVSHLVQSPEGHERVETLLNRLVVSTASSPASSPTSAQADHLANQLAQQCYLYFPPSSRFTYQGLRLANHALSHPPGSSQRRENGARAALHLLDAARYWQSASLITGLLVKGNDKGTFSQIAGRAIQYSSPLAHATGLLIKLEDVSNVVEICLRTSQNFKVLKIPAGPRDAVRYEGMLSWESDLYHKHSSERVGGPQPNPDGTQLSTPSEIYGSSVTSNDAIETCYALVFYHLEGLLQSNQQLADCMVSACSAVKDKVFLTSLFTFLLENYHVDTLLRIDSPEAEVFLKSQSDPTLLWRYYCVLEKFFEAGRVAFEKACSDGLIPLCDRIEWLIKALSSYRSAKNAYRRQSTGASEEELSESVAKTEESLKIASLQNRILKRIESLPEFPQDIDRSKYEALKTTLIHATPLYNEFVARVPFFDLCLVIFHMCRYDDPQAIRNLWKNVLCEVILPCGTRKKSIFHLLQQFAAEVDLADRVVFVSDNMEEGGLRMFEKGDWVVPLREAVIRLGKEIYGSGADYTFPVDYILDQLETLRLAVSFDLTPGWSLITLADAGVPYLVILDAYESVTQLESGMGQEDGLEKTHTYVRGSLELLNSWVLNSRLAGPSAGQHSTARIELSRSMSTGDLMGKLNSLRFKLEQMQGTGTVAPLAEELDAVEHQISYFVSL